MTEQSSPKKPVVLFTAFEPSGDAHAAPVIRALREHTPSLQICAWGGSKMEEAGATIIERTAADGSMGLNALAKVRAVRRQIRSIKRWIRQYPVIAHVPVDSPAANFPICPTAKAAGAKVIHLVAPQLWAWGGWRVKKLRRSTDLVLCLLPFEEQWFSERGIPARFVGHPAINRDLDEQDITERVPELPRGAAKIAIFPGSRSQEVKANLRLLVNVFSELYDRHRQTTGVLVAANQTIADSIRSTVGSFPNGLHMIEGHSDAVIAWCDCALAVSGTVSLHVARQHKPMVGVYRTGIVSWLGAKVLLNTPHRLLPNIVAEREICPEFIPHVGGSGPIVRAIIGLLDDSKKSAVQRESLRRVCMRFANKQPGEDAAHHILELIGDHSHRHAAVHK